LNLIVEFFSCIMDSQNGAVGVGGDHGCILPRRASMPVILPASA
jgi:hypothetical protein